jgi:hypothetical protein
VIGREWVFVAGLLALLAVVLTGLLMFGGLG